MFTRKQIQARVEELATHISNNHLDPLNPPVMICVLKGGFMFFSDLVKNMNIDCEIDFIKVKSYDEKERKEIKVYSILTTNTKGKDIYLVDDFLDSGNTIKHLILFESFTNPRSITPVTLFKRYNSPKLKNHLYGFEVKGDDFLYGYGMNDLDGLGRNLDYVSGVSILK